MIRGCILALMAAAGCGAQTAYGPIPPAFFGMTTTSAADFPKVTIGTLGHPTSLAWAWIEKSKGKYDFSGFDTFVAAAKRQGLLDTATNTADIFMTFGSTPRWAAADPSSCTDHHGSLHCTSGPANIQDWADFIAAVMKHYNGVTQPHIRYYELWNEANSHFWSGSYADLVNLAKAAYPIIHADPHSMLLTPSTGGDQQSLTATAWMSAYLKAGGAAYADGGAFHGYAARRDVRPFPWPEQEATPGCAGKPYACEGSIATRVKDFRRVFDENGLKGKPMYQTEGSWGDRNVTDDDDQIAWLARWYLLQAGLRVPDNLQMTVWFCWGIGHNGQSWGGIETSAGAPTSAGIAYNEVYKWLVGASMDEPCSSAPGDTWSCALTRPGGYAGLAVWNTAGAKPYTPGARFTQYRDLAGHTVKVPPSGNITIGPKPILLESAGKPARGSGPQPARSFGQGDTPTR
jgi:hypothetical protein